MIIGFEPDPRVRRVRRWESPVQFLIALFLFVLICGVIDARIKWPKARKESEQ
jgi:hypothetical protein